MKKYGKTAVLLPGILIVLLCIGAYAGVEVRNSLLRNRVYEDMDEKLSQLRSACIGIVPMQLENEKVTFGGGGSGVIFRKEKDRYYALTAAHIFTQGMDSLVRVYTVYTPIEYTEGAESVGTEFYRYLEKAKVEYRDADRDMAIISFSCSEELSVAALRQTPPVKGERLLCVGNPQFRQFAVTYGTVKRTQKTVDSRSADGSFLRMEVFEHDAYTEPGNSGGPVFSEAMELVGINAATGLDPFGRFLCSEAVSCDRLNDAVRRWSGE